MSVAPDKNETMDAQNLNAENLANENLNTENPTQHQDAANSGFTAFPDPVFVVAKAVETTVETLANGKTPTPVIPLIPTIGQMHDTYELEGKSFPFFPFDAPPVVKLRTSKTTHYFKMPTTQTEKNRENLLKTVIVTSPAVVNGENPREVKSDYSRSLLGYYNELIESVEGYSLTEGNVGERISVKTKVDSQANGKGQLVDILIADLIPVEHKRAAASRIFTGKMEVEKPKVEDEETSGENELNAAFNTLEDNEEISIESQVKATQKFQQAYVLQLNRRITVRQEMGVEQLPSGKTSDPTHVIRYFFKEPGAPHISKWEMQGHRGWAVNLNGGGEKAERFYNLDTMETLFNSLIDHVEGATVQGQQIDVQNELHLKAIPLSIKKSTMAMLFTEISSMGN